MRKTIISIMAVLLLALPIAFAGSFDDCGNDLGLFKYKNVPKSICAGTDNHGNCYAWKTVMQPVKISINAVKACGTDAKETSFLAGPYTTDVLVNTCPARNSAGKCVYTQPQISVVSDNNPAPRTHSECLEYSRTFMKRAGGFGDWKVECINWVQVQ